MTMPFPMPSSATPPQVKDPLFSPSLTERLAATNKLLKSKESQFGRWWDEGMRGSWNAYAVLVGPSYGKFNGTGVEFKGGRPRPTSTYAKAWIGGGIGLNPFPDGSQARQRRWNKLLLACLDTEDGVAKLSALFNLDWGHHSSERDIPPENLAAGADDVASELQLTKPRIVVALTKLVWSYLLPALIKQGAVIVSDAAAAHHQAVLIRLPQAKFLTVVIRPKNHPSRHFLTNAKIKLLQEDLQPYKSGID